MALGLFYLWLVESVTRTVTKEGRFLFAVATGRFCNAAGTLLTEWSDDGQDFLYLFLCTLDGAILIDILYRPGINFNALFRLFCCIVGSIIWIQLLARTLALFYPACPFS